MNLYKAQLEEEVKHDMASHQHGLGRGLDTLFRNAPEETAQAENLNLPVRLVHPCKSQPRKFFDETTLDELAESIRSQGVVQPILVRPMEGTMPQAYEIVAGERRWRAAKRAGLSEVPVLVRHFTDDEALTVALIENVQRENLNPLEEAEAIQTLRNRMGISQEELAGKLGKSRSAVANALRLLQLPKAMRKALGEGLITPGHARALLALTDETLQGLLFESMVQRQLSVRDAESAVLFWKKEGVLPEGFTQQNNAGEPETARAAKSRAPKPEAVKAVQQLLRGALHPKATVSGTRDLGRVTIPYDSTEQLEALLQRLGLDNEPR